MKLLDLYICSRVTTVKRVSRAGLAIENSAARLMAWNAITTPKTGAIAMAANPRAVTPARRASATPAPKRRMTRPVNSNCTASVLSPTDRSMSAKTRVRSAALSNAPATMAAC